MASHSRISPS